MTASMDTPELDLARAVAGRAEPRFGNNLAFEVEKLIQTGDIKEPGQYVGVAEVVAIATFILSCAKFAWDIYKDRKPKEVVKRELRLKVTVPVGVDEGMRDFVIEATVDGLP